MFYKSWYKKIGLFIALLVLYTLIPFEAQRLIGCFAVGWMLMEICDKVID